MPYEGGPAKVGGLIQDVAREQGLRRRPPDVRARRLPPMIDVYLRKAFSTRDCRW